eukprot:s319_g5.t1
MATALVERAAFQEYLLIVHLPHSLASVAKSPTYVLAEISMERTFFLAAAVCFTVFAFELIAIVVEFGTQGLPQEVSTDGSKLVLALYLVLVVNYLMMAVSANSFIFTDALAFGGPRPVYTLRYLERSIGLPLLRAISCDGQDSSAASEDEVREMLPKDMQDSSWTWEETSILRHAPSVRRIVAEPRMHLYIEWLWTMPTPASTRCTVTYVWCSWLAVVVNDEFTRWLLTLGVACISPAAINADETISTCRFATSVKKVKTNACVNVDRKKGVVQHLQAEIRRLKKLLAARGVEVGALGAGSVQEEIADRERVLKTLKQSYQVQVEEARLLATARKEALNQQGLSSEEPGCCDVDEVFGLEKNTPHLLNMSDDPVLSGCLVYFLPKGQITKVGSHPDNQIVIQGLGISNFICQFENPDQRNVVISLPSEYVSSRARVLVNGKLLARDERVTLQHFDRLIFGRASMMKLVIPLEQQDLRDLAATKTDETVLSDDNDDDDGDSGPPVRSRRSELRLYFGDLQARLGEERGNEFFYHLSKASHLVDEANEITTEIRPEDRGVKFTIVNRLGDPGAMATEDRLKFEVELVWDIHRHVSDIILIRALRLAQSQEPTVLSYWTVASFRQRLEVMRDCYDAFCCQGHWPGKGDPLEDA